MKVLVFEWMVGGGLWWDNVSPRVDDPFLQQGSGMFRAIATDLGRAGHDPVFTLDARCHGKFEVLVGETHTVRGKTELPGILQMLAAKVDRILLVAPELGYRLENLQSWLAPFEHKFVGPDRSFVSRFAPKSSFLAFLAGKGIAVPPGKRLDLWLQDRSIHSHPLPAVIKPERGAGGEGVRTVEDWNDFDLPEDPGNWRVEQFITGFPMSVAIIQVGAAVTVLPPLGQSLSGERVGSFVNCIYPVAEHAASKASDLAHAVVGALPAWNGYVGLDLVFEAESGIAIPVELNCRLTMSYVFLRRIYSQNLAKMLL